MSTAKAATEIEADGNVKDPHQLAQYYLQGDYADRAIQVAEPKHKLPADFQIELSGLVSLSKADFIL